MVLDEIKEGLPEELTKHLLDKEKVYYFSYISYKGGCLSSSSREEYWIALTDRRVIYKAKVKENNSVVEKEGMLPFEKVSFIEVTDVKESSGCSSAQSYELRISTSGGMVRIPIPTKEKGHEIKRVFSEIEEHNKKGKRKK